MSAYSLPVRVGDPVRYRLQPAISGTVVERYDTETDPNPLCEVRIETADGKVRYMRLRQNRLMREM